MLKTEALHGFWSSFGIPAYDESTVPPDAVLPYITYEVITDNIGSPVYSSAKIHDRSMSWRSVTEIADRIADTLGYGGITLHFDNGLLLITQGAPFSQRLPDDTDNMRKIMINVVMEFISAT